MLFAGTDLLAGEVEFISVFLRSNARRQVLAQCVDTLVVEYDAAVGMDEEDKTMQRVGGSAVFVVVFGFLGDVAVFYRLAIVFVFAANLYYARESPDSMPPCSTNRNAA